MAFDKFTAQEIEHLKSLAGKEEKKSFIKMVKERLLKDVDLTERISCCLCTKINEIEEKKFKSLAFHISRYHKISTAEYKKEFPGSKILTEATKIRLATFSTLDKTYTKEERKLISENTTKAMARPEVRDKMMKGLNTPEVKAKLSANIKAVRKRTIDSGKIWGIKKGYVHSEEAKRKMSISQCERNIKNPQKVYSYGKSGHYYCGIKNEVIYYRSSMELDAIKILSEMMFDGKIIDFKQERKHKIIIPITHTKHYVPDFLIIHLDNSKEVIEVKPKWKIKYDLDNTVLKIEKAEEFCKLNNMKFSVWDQDILYGEK